MGQVVCAELAASKMPFIVIDREEDAVESCREQKWPFIVADSTEDRRSCPDETSTQVEDDSETVTPGC